MQRLELIADTSISPNIPVMTAAGRFLELRHGIIQQIAQRCNRNDKLLRAVKHPGMVVLQRAGGWYGVIELKEDDGAEAWCMDVLYRLNVYIYPGEMYDFPENAAAVVSLLTPEDAFKEGLARISI